MSISVHTFVCLCTYVCLSLRIHFPVSTYICLSLYTCLSVSGNRFVCLCTNVCLSLYICLSVSVAYMHLSVSVNMSVCLCTYVCLSLYIHLSVSVHMCFCPPVPLTYTMQHSYPLCKSRTPAVLIKLISKSFPFPCPHAGVPLPQPEISILPCMYCKHGINSGHARPTQAKPARVSTR